LDVTLPPVTPGGPPVSETYAFAIACPFPFARDVPVMLNGLWVDGTVHFHRSDRLLVGAPRAPAGDLFHAYTFRDSAGACIAGQVGNPGAFRFSTLHLPGTYRGAQGFLLELFSHRQRVGVSYEVRTLFDLAHHPDPSVRLSRNAGGLKVVAAHTIPQATYQVWTADNLAEGWVHDTTVIATGAVHGLEARCAEGRTGFFRIGKAK
jgi:hypothetical protein